MFKKANFHYLALSIISIVFSSVNVCFSQDQNDYYNCSDNYDEIVCLPLIKNQIEAFISDPNNTDEKLSFALKQGDLEYYAFEANIVTQNTPVTELYTFYPCTTVEDLILEPSELDVIIVCLYSPFLDEWFCENGNEVELTFDPTDFDFIEIWNINQPLPNCSDESDLDPCSPCIINVDCIDPDLVDDNITCIELYDPVCGCDSITYQNECFARFKYGVTDVESGPCNKNTCIDSSLIDDSMFCNAIYDPVCGCDGKTYPNACIAKYYYGVSALTIGACVPSECVDTSAISDIICIQLFDPVCGCDGVTYPNECFAAASGVKSWTKGECGRDLCIDENLIDQDIICPALYEPVCGCDNITYSNACYALRNGVINYIQGECPELNCDSLIFVPLPIIGDPESDIARDSCDQIGYDPVCGCDGVDYDNSCFAFYNGVEYYTIGECAEDTLCYQDPIDIDFCIELYDPVCGCDGQEYDNSCEAVRAGIIDWVPGNCECQLTANIIYRSIVVNTVVDLIVENGPIGYSYVWEYKKRSAANWINIGTTNFPTIRLVDLEECEDYEWRVEIICDNGVSAGEGSTQEFTTECDEGCQLPQNIEYISTPGEMEVGLKVENISGGYSFRWEYRKKNDSDWLFAGTTNNPGITISNLIPCEDYQWRVEIICDNGVSAGEGSTQEFTTECDEGCQLPQNVEYSSIPGEVEADLQVKNISAGYSYRWEYKKRNDSSWIFVGSTNSPEISIGNLEACQDYEWRVEIICDNGESAGKSSIQEFKTKCDVGCQLPSDIQFNISPSFKDVEVEINITLSNIRILWEYKRSDENDWLYAGDTEGAKIILAQLDECTSYDIRIQIECADGSLSEKSEIVSFETDCTDCAFDNQDNLKSEVLSENEVRLELNSTITASTYQWQYRIKGSSDWSEVIVSVDNFILLEELESCTSYEWRTKINCDFGQSSSFSDIKEFTTDCFICELTEDNIEFEVEIIGVGEVELMVSNINISTSYVWEYRPEGTTTWIDAGATNINSTILNDFEDCQSYEWRVRIDCINGLESDFSDVQVFSTNCEECIDILSIESEIVELSQDHFVVELLNVPSDAEIIWQFKLIDDEFWTFGGIGQNTSNQFVNLSACNQYEWRVEIFCANDISSGQSIAQMVTTECTDCQNVNELEPEVLSEGIDFIELKIDQIPVQNPYFIWKYRSVGEIDWINVVGGSDQTILIDYLSTCSVYEYYLEMYCEDGEFAESEIMEVMTSCITSVSSIENIEQISLYPNPFSNEIYIDLDGSDLKDLNYIIYSIDGQLIEAGELNNDYSIKPNISVQRGIYILKIFNRDFQKSIKLIKM